MPVIPCVSLSPMGAQQYVDDHDWKSSLLEQVSDGASHLGGLKSEVMSRKHGPDLQQRLVMTAILIDTGYQCSSAILMLPVIHSPRGPTCWT